MMNERTGFRMMGVLIVSLAVLAISGLSQVLADSALLSERTYKRLAIVHELMGEEKYDDARKRLDALAKSVSGRDYENAVVMQTYGYLYVSTGKPRKAIDAFTRSLASGALPQPAAQNVRLNLAQLYLSVERKREALEMYEAWIELEKTPSAAGYALGGTLYAEVKDYTRAAKYLNSAIGATDQPREDWYRLLLSVYYEDKKYTRAASLLKTMIERYPDRKEYWRQLSAVYSVLGNDRESLAVLDLAYLRGFLTEGREQLNLARFFSYLGMPYRAAELIETAMQDGALEANRENLEVLYQAYLAADELERAVAVLHRLSDLSGDGETLLKIARLQVELERWGDAGKSIAGALDRGGLEEEGQAYLLQGITYYELDRQDKAVQSFRRALRDKKSAGTARQWLAFLEANRSDND